MNEPRYQLSRTTRTAARAPWLARAFRITLVGVTLSSGVACSRIDDLGSVFHGSGGAAGAPATAAGGAAGSSQAGSGGASTATSSACLPGAIAESGYELTFDDEFTTFTGNAEALGSPWSTTFRDGDRTYQGKPITPAGEQQLYVDAAYRGSGGAPLGLDPFSLVDGALRIRADRTPDTIQPFLPGGPYPFVSGLLSTERSFAQRYGYFVARMKMSLTKGAWATFWFMPQQTWTPQLAAPTIFGETPTKIHQGVNSALTGASTEYPYDVTGSIDEFHSYGVEWRPDGLTWYVDGVASGTSTAVSELIEPMFMLLNVPVGGGTLGGDPDATSSFPASIEVDYVRAYAKGATPIGARCP